MLRERRYCRCLRCVVSTPTVVALGRDRKTPDVAATGMRTPETGRTGSGRRRRMLGLDEYEHRSG